jgi:polar amino acid transport system substrate-binding protein
MPKLTLRLAAMALAAAGFAGQALGQSQPGCEPKFGHPPLARKGTLIAGINPTIAPLQYIDDDGNIIGLDVDFGNAIADRLCLKIFYQSTQYATMIPLLKEGRIDMIDSLMFYTPERATQMFMVPYGASAESILVNRDNKDEVKGLAYFSGKTLALELGTTELLLANKTNEELKAAGKPLIDIHSFGTYADVLQAFRAGQADGVVIGTEQAFYYRRKGADFYRIAMTGLDPHAEALAFADQGIAQKVADILNEMQADGSFAKIFEPYKHCTLPPPHKITTGPMPAPVCKEPTD